MEALGAMEDRLRVCKAKLKAKNKRIQSLQDELTEGGIRWDMQGDILDKMEQYSRRNSVRIQHLGWMENDNEECVDLRYDYAKEHQITLTRKYFDVCHRVGKKMPGRIKPIIAKFVRRNDRSAVLSTREQTKGHENTHLY